MSCDARSTQLYINVKFCKILRSISLIEDLFSNVEGCLEAFIRRCWTKTTLLWNISWNSQGNTYNGVQLFSSLTLLKTGLYCICYHVSLCAVFWNSFSIEHLWTATSKCRLVSEATWLRFLRGITCREVTDVLRGISFCEVKLLVTGMKHSPNLWISLKSSPGYHVAVNE